MWLYMIIWDIHLTYNNHYNLCRTLFYLETFCWILTVSGETVEAAKVRKEETWRPLWPSSRDRCPLLWTNWSQESHHWGTRRASLSRSHLLE